MMNDYLNEMKEKYCYYYCEKKYYDSYWIPEKKMQ